MAMLTVETKPSLTSLSDKDKPVIALLGGSFDPVHLGHLAVAEAVYRHFSVYEIWFSPCFRSHFKGPTFFNAELRLSFLKKAIQEVDYFKIWAYELSKDTPSYTHETVEYFSLHYQEYALSLILGLDAFLAFTRWRAWEEILRQTNLIVVQRPGVSWSAEAWAFFKAYQGKSEDRLARVRGKIFWLDVPTLPISSSLIKEYIRKRTSLIGLVPPGVWNLMNQTLSVFTKE